MIGDAAERASVCPCNRLTSFTGDARQMEPRTASRLQAVNILARRQPACKTPQRMFRVGGGGSQGAIIEDLGCVRNVYAVTALADGEASVPLLQNEARVVIAIVTLLDRVFHADFSVSQRLPIVLLLRTRAPREALAVHLREMWQIGASYAQQGSSGRSPGSISPAPGLALRVAANYCRAADDRLLCSLAHGPGQWARLMLAMRRGGEGAVAGHVCHQGSTVGDGWTSATPQAATGGAQGTRDNAGGRAVMPWQAFACACVARMILGEEIRRRSERRVRDLPARPC
ncbi:hypothetical protein MRB53_041285 [Persea americana]|nr:hypothetical protein MRB53_041285 [Persea americana]